jgi:UDP-glucose 4-epimerase
VALQETRHTPDAGVHAIIPNDFLTVRPSMKILVTGAAGFIGMHASLRLLARGDEVVGLDNLNDYYDPTLKEARLARLTPHAAFRFVKMDVADRAGMEALFAAEKFDA